jgi:hypothetical protein
MSGLERLDFLLGRWKGRSTDQFGEKGIIESSLECTKELDGRFLQLRGESTKDGSIINRAITFITFNSRAGKYISKRMWSYGFIENGEGDWEDDGTDVRNPIRQPAPRVCRNPLEKFHTQIQRQRDRPWSVHGEGRRAVSAIWRDPSESSPALARWTSCDLRALVRPVRGRFDPWQKDGSS